MPVSVLNHRKKAEHMETVLPKKDKKAVKKVTTAEAERDSEEKVVMAAAKDTVITAVAKDMAITVAAKDMAITAAARDTAITAAAITMVVISDSIVAHPIAIGTMC